MEVYLCEDVLGIIFGQLSYDLKNIFIINKYCYKAFLNFKKASCVGNYYLTSIQQKLVNQMVDHIDNNKEQSLIIQSNISTGKTCACLTFALNKYKGTVVIMVPLSVMPQWHNEIIKMYGNTMHDKITILHENYTKNRLVEKCRANNYNPSCIGYKVIIVSCNIRTSVDVIALHSVVLMDEVHTKHYPIYNCNFIGVTASKAAAWRQHKKCNYIVYEEEEVLPTITEHNVICGDNVGLHIEDIMVRQKGPYLIIGNAKEASLIPTNYINYDRTPEILTKINNMKEYECAFLEPGNNCTGINLIHINCVLFIHPTTHINATVIQAIGRVKRVTSKNKNIVMYNLHNKKTDIYIYKTYMSENEINQFVTQHHLLTLKYERSKCYIEKVVTELLKRTTYDELDKIEGIYYALLVRLVRYKMHFLIDVFSQKLNIDYHIVKYCFR